LPVRAGASGVTTTRPGRSGTAASVPRVVAEPA
jgi:hypothetical protein